jgi:hypothetical protein
LVVVPAAPIGLAAGEGDAALTGWLLAGELLSGDVLTAGDAVGIGDGLGSASKEEGFMTARNVLNITTQPRHFDPIDNAPPS